MDNRGVKGAGESRRRASCIVQTIPQMSPDTKGAKALRNEENFDQENTKKPGKQALSALPPSIKCLLI